MRNRRCVIFTAYCEGAVTDACQLMPDDYILCADGGYALAQAAGASPAVVIGDFDSGAAPVGTAVIHHPVMKDDTDTMLCVKHGMEHGCKDFLIVGGLGGRLDHTLANIQTLAYIARHGGHAALCDGKTKLQMLQNETVTISRTNGKLAVFAIGGVCTGVTLRGTKYEAENATLTPDFPLGMGNDFAADTAEISVADGLLLVVWDLA